jgi:phosphate transport system protein
MTATPTGRPFDESTHDPRHNLDRSVGSLKRRLVLEAGNAIAMLEAALKALWTRDTAAAREVRRRDDTIDREEVEIEQDCLRLLTLQAPVARDFRMITFVLKVNNDIERVADHAASIAKITTRLESAGPIRWPTALEEMAERVPAMCHTTMRALLDENAALAAQIVVEDKTIDELERRLFEETEQMMRSDGDQVRGGLLVYRIGRELERIGDLMKNIAEDVIYLATGSIVRHEKRRAREAGGEPRPA